MNVLQYAVKWVMFLCSTVLFLSYLYNLCELPFLSDRLTFTKQQEPATGKRKAAEEEPTASKKVTIQPHFIENRGPYPYNQPKKYVLYNFKVVQ